MSCPQRACKLMRKRMLPGLAFAFSLFCSTSAFALFDISKPIACGGYNSGDNSGGYELQGEAGQVVTVKVEGSGGTITSVNFFGQGSDYTVNGPSPTLTVSHQFLHTGAFTIRVYASVKHAITVTDCTVKPFAPLVIEPAALPPFSAGQQVSVKLSATGGSGGPYTFVRDGGGNSWLNFDAASQTLTGSTSLSDSSSNIYFTVTDAGGHKERYQYWAQTGQFANQITMSTFLDKAVPGKQYVMVLRPYGGMPPYTFALTEAPAWLTIDAKGVLAGKPPSEGSFPFKVLVTDSANRQKTFDAALQAVGAKLTLAPTSLGTATYASPYSSTLVAGGGTAPYQYSLSGAPSWLTVNNNGTVSGTPAEMGTFTFNVVVKDSSNTTSTFPITLFVKSNAIVLENSTTRAIGGPASAPVPRSVGGRRP